MTARLVGCALAEYANGDGGSCYPSQRTIAVAAGCSERAVRDAVRTLAGDGWIEITPEAFRGGEHGQAWRRNHYRLTPPEGEEPAAPPSAKGEESAASSSPEGAEPAAGNVRQELPDTKSMTKNTYKTQFEEAYAAYPRKIGRKKAERAYIATRRRGVEAETLRHAASRYAAVCQAKGTEKDYIKHPSTFFGPDEPWQDYTGAAEPLQRTSPYGGRLQ